MAARSKSSKLFAERAGLRPTYPAPAPAYEMFVNPAHTLPLEPPLPIPEAQARTQGEPRPDRGPTEEWPHGAT